LRVRPYGLPISSDYGIVTRSAQTLTTLAGETLPLFCYPGRGLVHRLKLPLVAELHPEVVLPGGFPQSDTPQAGQRDHLDVHVVTEDSVLEESVQVGHRDFLDGLDGLLGRLHRLGGDVVSQHAGFVIPPVDDTAAHRRRIGTTGEGEVPLPRRLAEVIDVLPEHVDCVHATHGGLLLKHVPSELMPAGYFHHA